MEERRMHTADLATAVVLIVFSITAVVLSIQMPRLEHRGINPYTVPGLVPGFLGVVIGLLSIALLVRSIVRRGYRLHLNGASIGAWIRGDAVWRIGLTVVLSSLYALGMVGRLNYLIATPVYVFFFIVLFEWKRGEPLSTQRRTVIGAGIEAVLATATIAGVFRYVFLVDLP